MKLQQFLALSVGTEIKAFKGQRFVVDKRETLDGIEQPCLVDIQTREPLFGAIYIPHLLGFEGQVARVEEVSQDEGSQDLVPLAVVTPTAPAAVEPVAPEFNPECEVELYDHTGPGYPSDGISVFEITCLLIAQQPSLSEYQSWYEAP